mmetsp:Transcript_9082/g.13580  ORF Transcript_9082/g.13580 Transcript_9082/m.13580 type:complete len:328 (-) Transcript_9082:26-1009(-)
MLQFRILAFISLSNSFARNPRLSSKFVFSDKFTSKRRFSMSGTTSVNVALCQIATTKDKALNIKTACDAIAVAAQNGSDIISLPECFNSPYDSACFPHYAEEIPNRMEDLNAKIHPSTYALSKTAKNTCRYIIGGSIPEREGEKVFNTCLVFGPDGSIIGKHRKMHLFDIDVPGKITFKESDSFSPGNSITVVDLPMCKIGLGICYDIRFPELSMLMREKGCSILFFPGAFNMTTGPAHWELLIRSRAVDNQCYVCAVSPARDPDGQYIAWGHSTVADPWGEVIATTNHAPSTVYAKLDLDKVKKVRESIPVGNQKRDDIYKLVNRL